MLLSPVIPGSNSLFQDCQMFFIRHRRHLPHRVNYRATLVESGWERKNYQPSAVSYQQSASVLSS
jgi:hypothetical protein